MILNHYVDSPFVSHNKKHFLDFGYPFHHIQANKGNLVRVKSYDLPKSSKCSVKYICDGCGKKGSAPFFSLFSKWWHYCVVCSHKGIEPPNKRKPFTKKEEKEILSLHADYVPLVEIGKRLNASFEVISRFLISKGISTAYRGKKPSTKCVQCGEPLKRCPTEIKELNYCNPTCRGLYQRKSIMIPCKLCGKKFPVKPHMVNKRKFCKHSCSTEYNKTGKKKKCKNPGCDKDAYGTKARPKKYCSTKCRDERKKTGKIVKCDFCGDDKYRPKCHLKRRGGKQYQFCSYECDWEHKRTNIERNKKIAKKLSKSQKAKFKNDPIWAKKRRSELSARSSRTIKESKKKYTLPEVTVYGLLDLLGIKFQSQKVVKSKLDDKFKIFDVYLPKNEIYIEVHGTYYHSDKRVYPDRSKLTKVQRDNVKNDAVKRSVW